MKGGKFNQKNNQPLRSFSAIPGFGTNKRKFHYNQVLVKVRVQQLYQVQILQVIGKLEPFFKIGLTVIQKLHNITGASFFDEISQNNQFYFIERHAGFDF
jgi:hypothetical protein